MKYILYFSLLIFIGQDQYDAHHQRSQQVQSSVSPTPNQDPYRQQQHHG
jgi:hypothetical protein